MAAKKPFTLAGHVRKTTTILAHTWWQFALLYILLWVTQWLFATADTATKTITQAVAQPVQLFSLIILGSVAIHLFLLPLIGMAAVIVKNHTSRDFLGNIVETAQSIVHLIVTWLVASVIATAGLIFFLLPGILLFILFSFYPFVVVEKKTYSLKALVISSTRIGLHPIRFTTHMLALIVPLIAILATVIAVSGTTWLIPLAAVMFPIKIAYLWVLYENL